MDGVQPEKVMLLKKIIRIFSKLEIVGWMRAAVVSDADRTGLMLMRGSHLYIIEHNTLRR
jgi:hypothetical protein